MRKMQKLFLIALLTVASTGALAQRPGSAAPHFSQGQGRRQSFSGHRSSFDPSGIFSDSFFSDALAQSGYPVSSQSPVIILQNALGSGSATEPTPKASQPLLIELQGNSYVHLSGPDDIHGGTSHNEPARQNPPSSLASVNNRPRAAASLAPVTLIFRDGHRDQVSDYTIADNVLYARGDYYADGSWSKKIALSSLNLPETIKLNQAPEVRFRLPAAPNEVITRP